MEFSKSAILDLHAAFHDCMGVVLDHVESVTFEVMTRELAGFARPTVRDQIAHVFSAETAWISALQLLPLRRFDAKALASVDDFRGAQREAIAATHAYLESIDERQLNSMLERYHEEWTTPHRTPAFILMHVITHGFHHKGQIVAMLRLLGYPSPIRICSGPELGQSSAPSSFPLDLILAERQEYPAAANDLRNYLRFAPRAPKMRFLFVPI